jgi:hypothetical protein
MVLGLLVSGHWDIFHMLAWPVVDGVFKVAWPGWTVLTTAAISSWLAVTLPSQHLLRSSSLLSQH